MKLMKKHYAVFYFAGKRKYFFQIYDVEYMGGKKKALIITTRAWSRTQRFISSTCRALSERYFGKRTFKLLVAPLWLSN